MAEEKRAVVHYVLNLLHLSLAKRSSENISDSKNCRKSAILLPGRRTKSIWLLPGKMHEANFSRNILQEL